VRIVILGAGIVGATTAYYLARDGHEVTVVERQSEAGTETSFANGGLVTPSMADPWAAPGVPAMLLKGLGRDDAPFVLRLRAIPGMIGWGLRFLRNCGEARWRENTAEIFKLATYSRDALDRLTEEAELAYDRFGNGTMRVYRSEEDLAAARAGAEMYGELGIEYRTVDGAGAVLLEPSLAPVQAQIVGAMHFPGDRSGDAFKFTQAIARLAQRHGAAFRYGTTATGWDAAGDKIAALITDKGRVAGDGFVLAGASHSQMLARPLGLSLPVRPVKGYSATFPIAGWNNAPVMPLVDYSRKMAVTRLGDRIRLAGTVEFTGYDRRPSPARSAMLLTGFRELFPHHEPRAIEYWNGLRPMTPDGRPILGTAGWRNLWLNTGHGPLGWTLACGSALVTAALIAGRKPDVAVETFLLNRG
jgi:D-amino-acid dehydrogenase